VSLATHLRELSLTYVTACGFKVLKSVAAAKTQLESLSLIHCGVNSEWFFTLSQFNKLKRFVLRDEGDCSIYYRITQPIIHVFYSACPDLREVVLDTWSLGQDMQFDGWCLQRFSTFQILGHNDYLEVSQPFPNLKRLALWSISTLEREGISMSCIFIVCLAGFRIYDFYQP